MKRLLADTLFKRLFLLLSAALVLSHVLGFWVSHTVDGPRFVVNGPMRQMPPPEMDEAGPLPPRRASDLPMPPEGPPIGAGPMPGLPMPMAMAGPQPSALDILVRFIVVAVAAWVGARWLSAPMRRMSGASTAVAAALAQHRRPAPLDETLGAVEVRQTAEVFNGMARQLHEQFEARGLMMAAISHDLRTPLSRLRLRLEQLDPGVLKDRCVADVQEADRLIATALSALRPSDDAAAAQRVDLRSLLQSLTDDLADQGQAVACELPAGPHAVVLADTSDLQRVVGNLVGNALRHGGSARVSLAERDGRCVVRVDDDGPGIPPDELDAVFQPFYRVDASRSRLTGGSGLGLYIARDLARRHGGTLTLANRPEGGLRAELSLPRTA